MSEGGNGGRRNEMSVSHQGNVMGHSISLSFFSFLLLLFLLLLFSRTLISLLFKLVPLPLSLRYPCTSPIFLMLVEF